MNTSPCEPPGILSRAAVEFKNAVARAEIVRQQSPNPFAQESPQSGIGKIPVIVFSRGVKWMGGHFRRTANPGFEVSPLVSSMPVLANNMFAAARAISFHPFRLFRAVCKATEFTIHRVAKE